MTWARIGIGAGGLAGGLAVALGAYGAHGLRGQVSPEVLATFEIAVRYHMWHALALLATGLLALWRPAPAWTIAGIAFIVGTVMFSGSLYLMTLAGWRLGMVTPAGGLMLMIGWGALAIGGFRSARP